jgi:hypothetical protein
MVVSSASSKPSAGRIPGRRREIMVLPEPVTPDPRRQLELSETFRLVPRCQTAAQWAEVEAAVGRHCVCGCGQALHIARQHRRGGLPLFRPGHHPTRITHEVLAIAAKGGITSTAAARQAGVSLTTLLRLEGQLFPFRRRFGKYRTRILEQSDVDAVREWARARAAGEVPSATALAASRIPVSTPSSGPGHRKDIEAIHKAGGLTGPEAAKRLGITADVLKGAEGRALPLPPRFGPSRIRVYQPRDLETLQEWIATRQDRKRSAPSNGKPTDGND